MQDGGYARVPKGARAIPLHSREGIIGQALVDQEDYDLVSKHRWYDKRGYVCTSISPHGRGKTVTVYMHRLILGLERGDRTKVDHRDHDPKNNRRSNIRVCTHAENHQNRRQYGDADTSSQYRGVSWSKEKRLWQAYVQTEGKFHHLGFYEREMTAAKVSADFRAKMMPFSADAEKPHPEGLSDKDIACLRGLPEGVGARVSHLKKRKVPGYPHLFTLEHLGYAACNRGWWHRTVEGNLFLASLTEPAA